ncbi:unnamed protein product [Caretta caretta]
MRGSVRGGRGHLTPQRTRLRLPPSLAFPISPAPLPARSRQHGDGALPGRSLARGPRSAPLRPARGAMLPRRARDTSPPLAACARPAGDGLSPAGSPHSQHGSQAFVNAHVYISPRL